MPNIEADLDVAWASQAFTLLTSMDERVVLMAERRVRDTIKARTTAGSVGLEEVLAFLNSPPDKEEHCRSYNIRSLYSLVRGSLQRLNARFVGAEDGNVLLQVGDRLLNRYQSRQSSATLRAQYQDQYLDRLKGAVDQGRTFHCVSANWSSSSWIPEGKFITFSTYRFGFKVQLNLLPVKTVLRRSGSSGRGIMCRRCRGQPETLAHVLNRCHRQMGQMIRERHGKILQRLQKAIPRSLGEVFLEQEIPGDPERNRPDLVVVDEENKKIIVVDVTVPFEGEQNSLQEARKHKEEKYSALKSWLMSKYDEVTLSAFVVGALGSWDDNNEPVLRSLKIKRNYAKLFCKLCVLYENKNKKKKSTTKNQIHCSCV